MHGPSQPNSEFWSEPRHEARRDGVRLVWQRLGGDRAGLPLLMVMGWSGVKEDWRELAPALATDRPVVVFDNRGIGESDVPEGPYTVSQLANDALTVADAAGFDRFHLLGISMGGMIAQQVALDAGHRLERLVLGCTSHGGAGQTPPDVRALMGLQAAPGTPRRDMVERMFGVNYTPEWIAANRAAFAARVDESMRYRRSMRGIMHQMGAVLGFDVEARISAIDRPTLVVHGDADQLLPYPNAQSIAGKIPGARLHTVAGAGHLFWDVDGGASARAIRAFLDESAA